MGVVTTYATSDGRTFDDLAEAEEHERELEEYGKADWIERRRIDLRHRRFRLENKLQLTRDQVEKAFLDVSNADTTDCVALNRKAATLTDAARETVELESKLADVNRLLDRLDRDHDLLLEDNRDIDGSCKMATIGFNACGKRTVEGTRWCKDHIDKWCDRHGPHQVQNRYLGAYTYRYECPETSDNSECK